MRCQVQRLVVGLFPHISFLIISLKKVLLIGIRFYIFYNEGFIFVCFFDVLGWEVYFRMEQ
jgi:hypothetical protein